MPPVARPPWLGVPELVLLGVPPPPGVPSGGGLALAPSGLRRATHRLFRGRDGCSARRRASHARFAARRHPSPAPRARGVREAGARLLSRGAPGPQGGAPHGASSATRTAL
eukprot:1071239-Pyramimonas_sp.AAC.1